MLWRLPDATPSLHSSQQLEIQTSPGEAAWTPVLFLMDTTSYIPPMGREWPNGNREYPPSQQAEFKFHPQQCRPLFENRFSSIPIPKLVDIMNIVLLDVDYNLDASDAIALICAYKILLFLRQSWQSQANQNNGNGLKLKQHANQFCSYVIVSQTH